MKKHVIFYNRFVSLEDLKEFIGATDIYLTPISMRSRSLPARWRMSIGAGKAVISTPYWHAQELLAEGRGVLVPFRDAQPSLQPCPNSWTNPARLQQMRERAHLREEK